MVVNLADPIKPTPHFFKLLPLRQVSSPVDERYQNKKVENYESVFPKKIEIEVEEMRVVGRNCTAKKKDLKIMRAAGHVRNATTITDVS